MTDTMPIRIKWPWYECGCGTQQFPPNSHGRLCRVCLGPIYGPISPESKQESAAMVKAIRGGA